MMGNIWCEELDRMNKSKVDVLLRPSNSIKNLSLINFATGLKMTKNVQSEC